MSELPDGWSLESLSDVAVWGSGGTPQAGHAAFYGGDIPWAVIGDLNEATVMETRASITDAGLAASSAKLVPEGAVLLAMYGSIGKLGIAGRPMATNQAIAFALPNDRVLGKYLFYYLMSQRHQLDAAGKGATQRNISQTILRPWPIVLPEGLDEQQRIVDILEDHLSRLDAASQSLAEALRRSEMLRAVTLESLAPGDTPSRTVSELATDSGYGTSTKCVINGPGVPVVRIPNLSGGRVDLLDEKRVADAAVDLTRLMLEQDDLLIVRTNGSRDLIGRAAVVQPRVSASFASYLIRFKLDPSQVRPQWVRVMLGTPSVRRVLEAMAASSAGQYNLGLKKLNGVTIPCPPIEDQDRLLARFDEQEWALGSLTRSLAEGRVKAKSLRRSLLAAAFSGRLTGHRSDMEMVEEMAGV